MCELKIFGALADFQQGKFLPQAIMVMTIAMERELPSGEKYFMEIRFAEDYLVYGDDGADYIQFIAKVHYITPISKNHEKDISVTGKLFLDKMYTHPVHAVCFNEKNS